jgi:hypothetical protein
MSLPEDVTAKAKHIVDTLKETKYVHKESIDSDAGVYDCDCNGFVGYVLKHVASDHYFKIPKEDDQNRPRAFKYFEFFASLPSELTGSWQRIDLLKQASAGDIMAWRSPTIKEDENTGHVMILAETPSDLGGSFSVRIYDSAAKAHFDDQRETGVGSGVIKLSTDHEGRPIAFLFSPDSQEFDFLQIAIGRLLSV